MEMKLFKINGVDVLTTVKDGRYYYKASDLGLALGYTRGSNFNAKVKKLSKNDFIHTSNGGSSVYYMTSESFKKVMPARYHSLLATAMKILETMKQIESGEISEVSTVPVFSDLMPENAESAEVSPETAEKPEEKTEIDIDTLVEAPVSEDLMDIIRRKDEIIAELGRKAAYYDICLNSPELLSTTTVALDYGYSAKKLNETLGQLGVHFKDNNGDWQLYGKYLGKGYQSNKVMSRLSRDGTIHTTTYKCWTQKGRNFIYDILHENGIFTSLELNEMENSKN